MRSAKDPELVAFVNLICCRLKIFTIAPAHCCFAGKNTPKHPGAEEGAHPPCGSARRPPAAASSNTDAQPPTFGESGTMSSTARASNRSISTSCRPFQGMSADSTTAPAAGSR